MRETCCGTRKAFLGQHREELRILFKTEYKDILPCLFQSVSVVEVLAQQI